MNTFGRIVRLTTAGESHGPAMVGILDGIASKEKIDLDELQSFVDRRSAKNVKLSTPRKEDDIVEILSGIYNGITLGTPIAMLIKNKAQHSSDYNKLDGAFRPGHADYTYYSKFGYCDFRGGGRASGRETVIRVASGAIVVQILERLGVKITSRIISVGEETNTANFEKVVEQALAEGDSLGGIVEVVAQGVPKGLGEPVFGKADSYIASALMSVGAVKGVEFGLGFKSSTIKGSQNNDQICKKGFLTNNAGGILGGITNGSDIVVRCAVKPTPSINKEQKTVNINGKEVLLNAVGGRHDPAVVLRIPVVLESMLALSLLDLIYINKRL